VIVNVYAPTQMLSNNSVPTLPGVYKRGRLPYFRSTNKFTMPRRGQTYKPEELKRLSKLRTQYGHDWHKIKSEYNKIFENKRTICSLQTGFHFKQDITPNLEVGNR
jgi:hypothetical protein